MVQPVEPSYAEANLAHVIPSAAAGLGVPGFWDLLGIGEGYRHIVILLIDGLGLHALQAQLDSAPFLASCSIRSVQAAVPTTTPTGLATLGTGLPPGGHGLVGASFLVEGHRGLLHPLNWQDSPAPIAIQPQPTLFERLVARGLTVTTVAPRAYEDSGLTRAALRGGLYRGADSVGERLAETMRSIEDSQRALTYVYWPDLDRTGHGHGVDSDHWRYELQHVDYLAERIQSMLGPDDLLLVTADHGMVDCGEDDRIDIDGISLLRHQVRLIGGEPRCRYIYTRPGHAEEVAENWRSEVGDHAWVLTRSEAVSRGFFGDLDPHMGSRIGDVIAWAKDRWSLSSAMVDDRVSRLRGQHGSLTPDEVEIPLITARGGR